MGGFGTTRFIGVDWSGALRDRLARKKIWVAEAAEGVREIVRNGLNREEVGDYLIGQGRSDSHIVVGLDFAFSFPAWFLRQHGWESVCELWAAPDSEREAWLRPGTWPFWGHGGCGPPDNLPGDGLRRTDHEVSEYMARVWPGSRRMQPKSAFQVLGRGAVGTGTVRGMPLLRRLHNHGFSIWPFDTPGWPKVVEIYPRAFYGPSVKKKDPGERKQFLSRHYPHLDAAAAEKAIGSDDAFDALISALALAAHEEELSRLPSIKDAQLILEGLIWHPE